MTNPNQEDDFITDQMGGHLRKLILEEPLYREQNYTNYLNFSNIHSIQSGFPQIEIKLVEHSPDAAPYNTYDIKIVDKSGINHRLDKRYSEYFQAYNKIKSANDFILLPHFPAKNEFIQENLHLFFKKLLSNNLVLEGKVLLVFQDAKKTSFIDFQKQQFKEINESGTQMFKSFFQKDPLNLKNLAGEYESAHKFLNFVQITENLLSYYTRQSKVQQGIRNIKYSIIDMGLQVDEQPSFDYTLKKNQVENIQKDLDHVWQQLHRFLKKTARIYFDDKGERFLASQNNFFSIIYGDQMIPNAWKNKAWLLEEQLKLYLNCVEKDLKEIMGEQIAEIRSYVQ